MEPVPEWLAAAVEAAGKTAFTDEFCHSAKQSKLLHSLAPSIRKLIGHYRHDGHVDYAGLKRAVLVTEMRNMRPGR
ncbi:hypothetical protein [Georgfuchsia toluolica]|uniref:hypothetical protein n=1 Tax=Georgfuchsia toluolica TaxID=424218 RepID=UPI001C73C9FA|nr:hypothetical protein [Georgfuchsia toluolica]